MSEWKEALLEDLADEITVGFVGSMTDEYGADPIERGTSRLAS